MDRAVRRWAAELAPQKPDLRRLGYFGSYARGDWGVGSDLDLVAVVTASNEPFERRTLEWDLTGLPVPAEMLVYTETEFSVIRERGGRFASVLSQEAVWVLPESPPANAPARSRVARDIQYTQLARFAAMTSAARVAMARRLGEDDVLSFMATHGVDRRTAIARIKQAHRAGRRHSACAVDGDR